MKNPKDVAAPAFKALAADAFGSLANEYLECLRVRAYSEASLLTKKRVLGYFMEWCSDRGLLKPIEVTPPILERYQRHLFYYRKKDGKALTFGSQASLLTPIRSFFKWLAKKRYLPYNPASELELPRRGQSLPKVILTEHEVEEILSLPVVSTPLGIRDRAILETFYSTGIRRLELVNLKVHDLELEIPTLTVREGKGKKDRVLPLGKRAALWVEKYLYDARPLLATGLDEGILFLSNLGRAMPKDGMSNLVGGYVSAANLGKKGGCHLFRHTMATHMLENGADVRFVQEMLGHASLETTQIYTHVSIKKLREVHALTHPSERSLRDFEKEAEPREPMVEKSSGLTVSAVIEAYLKEKRGLVSGDTASNSRRNLSRFLAWYGQKPLSTLADPGREYAERRKKEGVSATTLRVENREINALHRFARDRGHVPGPTRYLSRADFEKVLLHLEPPLRLYLKFQRYMGLRPNEAAKLRHEAIRFDRARISSRHGVRSLKIPRSLLLEYRSLKRLSEWVFPSAHSPEKALPRPRALLIKACREATIPLFTLEALRYSFGVDLAEKGITGPVRGAILGLSTALDDEDKEARERAMAAAMDLISGD